MGTALSRFTPKLVSRWLADPKQVQRFLDAYVAAGQQLSKGGEHVLICAEDRVVFLAYLAAAMPQQRGIFLANSQWGAAEWAQAYRQMPADLTVLGVAPVRQLDVSGAACADYPGRLLIPTGGTGGRIKFAVHTTESLKASVDGYLTYWGGEPLNVICPLPVCHIGGLMLALRAAWTGGQLWLCDARLEEQPPAGFNLRHAHCSVVGAQLRRALDQGGHWLRECGAVLVGGGPSAPEILQEAIEEGIPLYTAYGLTEAAATVALAKVEPGADCSLGEVLPHWRVEMRDGRIYLSGEALFKGYWGEAPRGDAYWDTGDRGELVGGRLKVSGRAGRFVITGGRKVDADLLEKRLLAWPEIQDAVVFGAPHREWGEAVTAVVETSASEAALVAKARAELLPEMRPKDWRPVAQLPRTPLGKPDWPAIYSLMKST
ncbi:AMP-binding protein [Cerasicoccus frondis]|uniref:AMP-binding protein n=1 Tax=Cerasicoccus frondis TaxID=490090 RepID=UPI0028525AFF|nr:AMP-binding protein [Cerasicoccus frondis]